MEHPWFDGSDFDLWFTHLGMSNATYAQSDLNFDTHVDGADFDIWYTHLQNKFGGESQLSEFQSPIPNSSPVPEPAAALLLTPLLFIARKRR